MTRERWEMILWEFNRHMEECPVCSSTNRLCRRGLELLAWLDDLPEPPVGKTISDTEFYPDELVEYGEWELVEGPEGEAGEEVDYVSPRELDA